MELELDFAVSEPEYGVEELSVLEYAREMGICVDYTTELRSLGDVCTELKSVYERDPWGQGPQDQGPRCPFEIDLTNATTAAHQLTKERLALNKEAAMLLNTALTLREPLTDDALIPDARLTRDLKQELPVLRTDAELDMLQFGTRVETDLRDLRTRLPSEDLDEENDEGFGWPAKYSMYPAQCDAKIRSEKLAMTRDALTLLQNAVQDDFSPQDEERLVAEEMDYRNKMVTRHLTPPLLPLSPPLTPYIPSSPANRLPLIPESSDSVMVEARALEQQIMAKDSLIRPHSGSSDSMLLDVADLDALFDAQVEQATSPHLLDRTPTLLKSKRKADALKVEGPLTPEILSDSPMKKLKSVTFSNMIQVGDSLRPWSEDNAFGTSDPQDATEELIKEIGPIAKEANRRVENEKLTGADTVARVDIPDLDFTLPVAPWDEFSHRQDKKPRPGSTELEAQMRFLQRVKRDDLRSATTWRGVSDLDMSWGWFASASSTIKLNEKLHGETDFNKVQAELKTGHVATSANEVWKKDGLRVLDEDDDDEEDEVRPAEFEEQNDMEALVRKRKLELQELDDVVEAQHNLRQAAAVHLGFATHQQSKAFGAGSAGHPVLPALSQESPKAHHTPSEPRPQRPALPLSQQKSDEKQRIPPTELMFGGFSASAALHKFMETQGKAVKIATANVQTRAPANFLAHTISAHMKESSTEVNPSAAQGPDSISERISCHVQEPSPPHDLPPSFFIVSTSLLQRRPFIKQIERLHPNAELIYRDYNLPHSAAAEADFIISPSTGVLLTTLQQIKQAPLPGQAARSPLKERMTALQNRYERLIVLVSEGLREHPDSTRPEDPRDKQTLTRLDAFAAQLAGDVVIRYIRGGEHTLAAAVVHAMAQYGLPRGGADIGHAQLFAVETTWEIFLRRTGLNPFAAQIILAALKTRAVVAGSLSTPREGASRRVEERGGLPAFLTMRQDERVERFQAVLGGRRVLDLVAAVLDQRWVSARDGYKM